MTDTIIRQDGSFTAWQPCDDIVKASSVAGSPGKIQGYCSTQRRDRQGETLFQKGLDFREFVQSGFFNDNHDKSVAAQVGIPTMAEYHRGKGWWTEGDLLPTKRAAAIVELATVLKSTGGSRKLGFSVEGKALERDPFNETHVLKALIRQVAVTHCPVNPECTWDLVAKAMTAAAESLQGTNGRNILSKEDLEDGELHKVFPCRHEGCRKVFATADGLSGHKAKAHGKTSEEDSLKIVRKSVQTYTTDEARAYLRTLQPDWSEDLLDEILQKAKIGH